MELQKEAQTNLAVMQLREYSTKLSRAATDSMYNLNTCMNELNIAEPMLNTNARLVTPLNSLPSMTAKNTKSWSIA